MTGSNTPPVEANPPKKRYRKAVGVKLARLLTIVFGLFALIVVNSVYLVAIRILEWQTQQTYQDYFYMWMFLLHLVLGFIILLPVVIFGSIHMRNTLNRPNRRAVRVGMSLFITAIVLMATGVALTRVEGVFELKNPHARSVTYWVHVITPLIAVWLFVLHRLTGRRIKWRVGATWAAVAVVFAGLLLIFHAQDPRQWNVAGPASGEQYFLPSLARTATGNFIPAKTLMLDDYCLECHEDVHAKWSRSMHRFSSFNNPAYLFAVRGTRKMALERDGNVQASRFCAGCHDPVPFFSGAFDDPNFDDVNHSTAQAGITCTSCHAITNVNSPRGNSDFTIEEPIHYPFTFSENEPLQWVNRQLVKAKPEFHKKTFLKPLHQSAEFCGSCHKVHLPAELNDYKWLRGQNHYDTYLLSGVSGHGASAFYYPAKAEHNCNGCHMPLQESKDFAADYFDDSGKLKVHDHQFPSANTGVPHLLKLEPIVNEAHVKFLQDITRVDIFGLKKGGTIDGELIAPIRPQVPALVPGETYLVESVVRTTKMGHHLTQGTTDSNELWIDVVATTHSAGPAASPDAGANGQASIQSRDGLVVGRSGAMAADGTVDPWSHFVNAYVLDRNGKRIDQRNAQDIFVPLYNNQIPPGAADVIHYRLEVPEDAGDSLTVEVKLQYRKFDTIYMKYVNGADFVNDLPVTTMATDKVTFPIARRTAREGDVAATGYTTKPRAFPEWQRWNDYGIGLLRKGESVGSTRGELRQAEYAFQQVEALGQPDGPLNRARVYFREGRLDDAVTALKQASSFNPPAYPWVIDWFSGLVNQQNGFLDEAITNFTAIVDTQYPLAREREFDFSQDPRVLNQLGRALYDRAKLERGEARAPERRQWLEQAAQRVEQALKIDPELATSHWLLSQIYPQLGQPEKAAEHAALHAKYKVDDNARDFAVAEARRQNQAADHAAEAIVIYDLQRPGALGLPGTDPAGVRTKVDPASRDQGNAVPTGHVPNGADSSAEERAVGDQSSVPDRALPNASPAAGADPSDLE